jgi:hypothetical protein
MTDSSSKLLQIQGKWYQERKQQKKTKPEPKEKIKTILNPFSCPILPYYSNNLNYETPCNQY